VDIDRLYGELDDGSDDPPPADTSRSPVVFPAYSSGGSGPSTGLPEGVS
jgi:hypothetical protein